MKHSEAYQFLRQKIGLRPAVARDIMTKLNAAGFAIAKKDKIVRAQKISQQIDILIKLTKEKTK